MLKVRWRESHSVQFLKALQMTKTRILQLKSSADLMPATAKIHSQVRTTTSCKKQWSSPGAKSLNCRQHLHQDLGSFHTYMYDCRLKGYHSKCKRRHRWTNLKYIETDCNFYCVCWKHVSLTAKFFKDHFIFVVFNNYWNYSREIYFVWHKAVILLFTGNFLSFIANKDA